jgi:NADH-quinone oxidoreductase subunit G
VRFSQEIAEDYQLIFTERGADTFVATHDGHPYVAPFSGNIIELCPVGALTSQPYRFRARPWDVEGSGGICTLCPAQCNVDFTVRDERVLRVLARDNHDVDDGWLCDKGRFAYQAIHSDARITRPLVRDGGRLREVTWERALSVAAGLARHRGRVGAIAGGKATNEEGFLLQQLVRSGLKSPHLDSRVGGRVPLASARALAAPELQASVPDLEFAHAVLVLGCEPLDEMPILDLRIRKGVRRNGVKLAVATARPSALDRNAALTLRYAPGEEAALLTALDRMLAGSSDGVPLEPSGVSSDSLRALADLLRGSEDVVIVWGERLEAAALPRLLSIAQHLGVADRSGAGLLEIPAGSNGRGLREVGVLPNSGPGYADAPSEPGAGHAAADIARAAANGELTALYLFETDPVRDHPDRQLWNDALHQAALVVAHASALTDGLREHADVIFPAESYAEKEGTVVHPDGRVQRLRSAIGHPRDVYSGWWVLAELSRRVGLDTRVLTSGMAFAELVEVVPFYRGLTLEAIGGRGVRWPERQEARELPAGESEPSSGATTPRPSDGEPTDGALRLGTYRPIWAAPEVELSPALHYTIARQLLELSPEDARRLELESGENVVVSQNGTRLNATAHVRTGVPAGTAFLAEGIASDSANVFTESTITVANAESGRETLTEGPFLDQAVGDGRGGTG